MFDCNLICSIILLSSPLFIRSVIIAMFYTINILWISQHFDVWTLSGAGIGEVLFIVIGMSSVLGFTSPLSLLCSIAIKNQDYEMMGVFLQRSLIISHLLFLCLALVFWFSDYILIYILYQPIATAKFANVYLKFMIISLWILFVWTNFRRFLQSQHWNTYIILTIICGLLGEICALYYFDTFADYHFYGAVLSLCIAMFCQILSLCILLIAVGIYNAYHINKLGCPSQYTPSHRFGVSSSVQYQHHVGLSHIYSTGQLTQIHENNTMVDAYDSVSRKKRVCCYIFGFHGFHCQTMLHLQAFKYFVSLCKSAVFRIYSEYWCFCFIQIIIAGWISMEYLTAQTLTYNLLTLILKIQISVASATSLLLKQAIAKKDETLCKNIWDTSIAFGFVVNLSVAALAYWQRHDIAKFYVLMAGNRHSAQDMETRHVIYDLMTQQSLPWMCLYVVFNSVLLINQGVMQSIGQIAYCSKLNVLLYAVIALPIALITMLVTHWQLHGLWFAVCACLAAQCIIFLWKRHSIDWTEHIFKHIIPDQQQSRKNKYRYNDYENREAKKLRSWNQSYQYEGGLKRMDTPSDIPYDDEEVEENVIDNIDWFVDHDYNDSDDDGIRLRRSTAEISYGSTDLNIA